MLKYDFKNNNAVVDLPSIWKISNGKITITTASGEDVKDITLNGEFTVQVGNIDPIRTGGTKYYGYDKNIIVIASAKDSVAYNDILVNDITIPQFTGDSNWCSGEKVPGSNRIQYTALTENPTNLPRFAYFKYTTNSEYTKDGDPVLSEWWVTVMQEGKETTEPDNEGNENNQNENENQSGNNENNQNDNENQSGNNENLSGENSHSGVRPGFIDDEDQELPTGAESMLNVTLRDLLNTFNPILQEQGYNKVEDNSHTYGMLNWAFVKAKQQWDNKNSWMFDQTRFPDVYDWRAPYSKEFIGEAYASLQAWMMAMLLSELVCDNGTTTNTLTKLFKAAYEFVGGSSIPIYGLDIHADPMHSRLIAGCMYSYVRSAYGQESIDNMRNELGGHKMTATTWNELGYRYTELTDSKGTSGYIMNSCGYLVNSGSFIPRAAGPYAEDMSRPIIQVGDNINQTTRNYVVDEQIDDFIVQNFNLCVDSSEEEFRAYSPEKQLIIMNAVAAQRATKAYFFGSKKVKYTGKSLQNGIMHHRFVEDSNGVLVAGPFANVNIGMSNAVRNEIMDIADNSRFPTYHPEFGRCRPCGGTTRPSSARGANGSRENGMYNIDMSCIFASNEESRAKWAAESGFVKEKPKSYPSGHSTQTMAMAFILAQKDPNNIDKYVIPAYEVSVGRTVARMHWNSDAIYGRLFATMIAPIINAMPMNQTPQDITFTLRINNNTNSTAKLNGEFYVYLMKDKVNGVYTDSKDSGKYGLDGNGMLLQTTGVSKTTNGISIGPNSHKDFTVTLPKETVTTLSNIVAPSGGYSYNHPYNIVLYTYGKIAAENYTGHISNVCVPGFIDDDTNGVTLKNGSFHYVNINTIKTHTDSGNAITVY